MTHRELGGDPAADAAADEIELGQLQGIEDFEIVENHVFDGIDVLVFIGLRAAGVSGSDHACVLRELLMKRHPTFFDRVNVGEAVEVEQRRAVATFQDLNFVLVNVDDLSAQWIASADCSKLMPGYSSVNWFKEA